MKLEGIRIGLGMTGSFCTHADVLRELAPLTAAGAQILPILSYHTQSTDTRFGTAGELKDRLLELTGHEPILTIVDAEPLGPRGALDIMLIAPCTGNTAAKLANGITDTPVLMAAKGHLRVQKPLVLALATNDALGQNFKNIGLLLNSKNIFLVPLGQDNYKKKPNSMVSHMPLILQTLEAALEGRQLQPVLLGPELAG